MPDKIHQVRGILSVVNRKARVEADLESMFAQDPRADAVKGAGPGKRVGRNAGIAPQHLGADALHAARHLGSRTPGKRQEKNPPRIGTMDDQVRDAVGKRIRLAGSRAGNDEQRRCHR